MVLAMSTVVLYLMKIGDEKQWMHPQCFSPNKVATVLESMT